jgi:hypothetical protein
MPFPETPRENPEEEIRPPESAADDSTRAIEIAFTPPEKAVYFDEEASNMVPASEAQVIPPPLPELVQDEITYEPVALAATPPEDPALNYRIEDEAEDESPVREEPATEHIEGPKALKRQESPQPSSPALSERLPVAPPIPPENEDVDEGDDGIPDDGPAPGEPRPVEEDALVEKPRTIAPSEHSQEARKKIDASIAAEEVVDTPSPLEKEIHSSADYKLAFVRGDVAKFSEVIEDCEAVALEIPKMSSERFRLEMSEACSDPKRTQSMDFWLAELPRKTEAMIRKLHAANKELLIVGLTEGDPNYEYIYQAERFSDEFNSAQLTNVKESQLRVLLTNHIFASVMARQKEADCIAAQLEAFHKQWPGELIGVVLDAQHARGSLQTDSVVAAPSNSTYLNEAKNTEDAMEPIDPELLDRVLLEHTIQILVPRSTIANAATETVRGMSNDNVEQILDTIEAIKHYGQSPGITNQDICSFLELFMADSY